MVTSSVIEKQSCTSSMLISSRGWRIPASSYARFAAIQTAYEKNILSDEQLRNAFRAFYDTDAALRPKYDLWVANFPKSYVARLARAIYYRRIGQVQRGGGTISQTSDSRLRGMEAAFGLSMRDLQASTSLDKRPLLTVFNELAIAIHIPKGYRSPKVVIRSCAGV